MRKDSFKVWGVALLVGSLVPVTVSDRKRAEAQGDVWAGPVTEWPG
jgi:hypothetical protein